MTVRYYATIESARDLFGLAIASFLFLSCGSGCRPVTSVMSEQKIVASPDGTPHPSRPGRRSSKTPARVSADASRWEERWAKREMIACKVELKIDQPSRAVGSQGREQGTFTGRFAWSRVPKPRLRAHLEGTIGKQRCAFRLRSLPQALLEETWDPQVHYAVTRRYPQTQTSTLLATMNKLDQPALNRILARACAKQLWVPPASQAWELKKSGASSLEWQAGSDASQTLRADPQTLLPSERELRFKNEGAAGAYSTWSWRLECQSAS